MARKPVKPATEPAEIAEAAEVTTLEHLCVSCGVDEHWIGELVAHGVISPTGTRDAERRFASATIVRVRKAKRLTRDFDLNVSGVALALDLLDEIDRLRARLSAFERPRE